MTAALKLLSPRDVPRPGQMDKAAMQQRLPLNLDRHDCELSSPILMEEVVSSRVDDLRLHRSVSHRNLRPSEESLVALAKLGRAAWETPIPVTKSGVILYREDIWFLAERQKRPSVKCIVFDLTEEEALLRIINNHCEKRGFNKFVNVELALDYKETLLKRSRQNQQRGGRGKALPTLAKDNTLNVRQRIAEIAHVGTGTVPKVQLVLRDGIPEVLDAARNGGITVEAAFRIARLPRESQLDALKWPSRKPAARRNKHLADAQGQGNPEQQCFLLEVRTSLESCSPLERAEFYTNVRIYIATTFGRSADTAGGR